MHLCLRLALLPQRGREGLGVRPGDDLDVLVRCSRYEQTEGAERGGRRTTRGLNVLALLAFDIELAVPREVEEGAAVRAKEKRT